MEEQGKCHGRKRVEGNYEDVGKIDRPHLDKKPSARRHERADGLHGGYPALSVIVATVTCGQRTLLKTRITSCEYCSWR